MRHVLLVLLFPALVFGGRADNLETNEEGEVITSPAVRRVLDFPTTSTAYVVGRKYRTLLELETFRVKAFHGDLAVGEQFAGASVGYNLSAFGNISVIGGAGYDFDANRTDLFAGLSHRSTILALGSLKTFTGYDFLIRRLRYGIGYGLYSVGNWNLDAVGTSKLLGSRNFLGLSLGYDYFEGAGGGSKKKLEANIGVFVGYDFDETQKGHTGAGLDLSLRF